MNSDSISSSSRFSWVSRPIDPIVTAFAISVVQAKRGKLSYDIGYLLGNTSCKETPNRVRVMLVIGCCLSAIVLLSWFLSADTHFLSIIII